MRRTEPTRIGDLWSEFLRSAPTIARKIAEAKVADVWPAVVGSTIASFTTELVVKTGVLYVKMNSSVARNELFMRREALKGELNHAVGMKIINVIIVK